MVVVAGEAAGVCTADDPELSAFLEDIRAQLVPYVAMEWAQHFPRVFFRLGNT